MRSQRAGRDPGRRRILLVAAAFTSLIVGLVAGLAVATEFSSGGPEQEERPAFSQTPRSENADVVHNPPLIYEPGDKLRLEFDLVCPAISCGDVSAELTLASTGHETATVTSNGTRHIAFDVPTSFTILPSFTYHGSFEFADGGTIDYPTSDGSMSVVSVSEATVVDLGMAKFSPNDQDPGQLVVTGQWGKGPRDFGINEQLSGPSSFDIDPNTSAIVILDQVNRRLIRVNPDGSSETHPIQLRQGVPDLAVAPDGTLDILYVNAVSGAAVEQFAPDGGKAQREVPLATSSGFSIRREGNSVLVEGDDSYWFPISQGQELISPEGQTAAAASGLSNGTHLVIRKHLRELGNEVRIADSGPEGVRAWSLKGTTSLGPVLVAAPGRDGDVVVVQSQFDNDHGQYSIVTLGDQAPRIFVAPQSSYASHYGASEFRLMDSMLYQVRSTEIGYAIYQYEIE